MSVSFIALTLVMTVCFLCMEDAANDVELLLPSITESAAVRTAISCAFITIKGAISGAADQLSLGYRKHAT